MRKYLGDDRSGQMMLLTAFVLVIGFVALAGMVARATQLPEATQAAADRPIYIEAAAVARGVEQGMEDLNNLHPIREDGRGMSAYVTAVQGAMQHLVILESARGYRLQLQAAPSCDDLGPDLIAGTADDVAVMSATFALADTETSIQFTITYRPHDAWTQTAPADEGDPALWADGVLNPDDGGTLDADEDVPITSCIG